MKETYKSYLSPIDEYSNLPFRMLCQKQGAEATCVPLVNSTAISRNPIKADEIDAKEEEKNIGIQIVGNVPE
jgi:tRNA-dihydrouridine synthase